MLHRFGVGKRWLAWASGGRIMVIGLFGVVVPLAGGYLIATAFGFVSHKAMLLGICFTATSIAITADTLREMNQLGSSIAKAIIGAAVVDDVLALLALSIGNQVMNEGFSAADSLMMLVKGLVFFGGGAYLGQKYFVALIYRIDRSDLAKKYTELAFIFAMMMAFLFAIIAELFSLSAIVGAFVAGVALEGVQLIHNKDFREGAEYDGFCSRRCSSYLWACWRT